MIEVAERPVAVPADGVALEGDLRVPDGARGIILFAHGSGSGRHSPRNRFVAEHLNDVRLATLLLDLLTADEERTEAQTRHLRFDIDLLAERLLLAADWLAREERTGALPLGLFGASTGAGAALVAAARAPEAVRAVVSRGGRPDLAGDALAAVQAPTLLLVGGDDAPVIDLNRRAERRLSAPTTLEIVPQATHLFEEPGALEQVADAAREWFLQHLR